MMHAQRGESLLAAWRDSPIIGASNPPACVEAVTEL